jgi:hypothetical protein
MMAWRAGNFVVAAGAAVTVEFNWQGRYNGVQFAQARPVMDLGPFLPAITGERTVRTLDHALAARRGGTDERIDWLYRVTVENPSPDFAVFFDLTGGKVEP